MPDSILSIGAVFDKAQLEGGFASASEAVKAGMDGISVAIESANKKTRAATEQMQESMRAFAKTTVTALTEAQLAHAESVKKIVAANAQVRAANVLTKDSTVSSTTSTLAQATALSALSEARKEEAATAAAVSKQEAAMAEEANLSSNMFVRAWQKAALEVNGAFDGMRERMVLTGKTGDFSLREFATGFAGVGEVLGGIVVAGMFEHFVSETAKTVDELNHLSISAGIAIAPLSGLKEVVEEMGVEWEPVTKGVVRLQRAIVQAQYGMADYVRAFEDIGISMDDLKGKTPEQQLDLVAAAMAKTAETGRVADASLTLFSRSGLALIPVMKEYGGRLSEVIDATGKLTGVDKDAAEAAEDWIRTTQRFSMEWHRVLIPAMEFTEDFFRGLRAVFESLGAIAWSAFEAVATGVVAALKPVEAFSKSLYDLVTGNFRQALADASSTNALMVQTFRDGAAEIKANFAEVGRLWTGGGERTFRMPQIERGDVAPPASGVKGDEQQLYQMKLDHDVSLQEEIKFWKEKLAAAEKGSKDYEAIVAKLAPLMEKQRHGAAGAIARSNEEALNELKLSHEVTLEEEIAFWQRRLAAAKKGSAEYEGIIAKLAPLMQREMKQKPAAYQPVETQSPDMSAASDAYIKSLEAEVKQTQTAIKDEIDAYRDEAEEKIRLAREDYAEVERNTQFEVRMGRMTAEQRNAALLQAAEREKQIVAELSRYIQMLDSNDVRRHSQDLQQEVQQERQWASQIRQIMQQTALETQIWWKKAWQEMTRDMNAAVAQWVVQGRGFEQSMAKVMNSITQNFVANILKMMEQEVVAAIQHKALMSQQIMADAAKAASGAWAATADIPIVGPVLAPIAAAAAFAGVMAFDSFDQGGIVGNRMGVEGIRGAHVPILAEAGERVLSPSQTANFERMVSQSSSSSVTQHNSVTQHMHGYDRAGMKAALRENAGEIFDIVRSGYRSGALTA